jgi:hypothetical protein
MRRYSSAGTRFILLLMFVIETRQYQVDVDVSTVSDSSNLRSIDKYVYVTLLISRYQSWKMSDSEGQTGFCYVLTTLSYR